MRRSTSTRGSTSPPVDRPASRGRPAAFLDRDGTIVEDRNYLADPGQVRLLAGAAKAIARLNRAGLPVIVVTNQSGIGRGYYSHDEYFQVQQRIEEILAAEGASLTTTYHCPHSPDRVPSCECRKPAPGLFERAAREHRIDLETSYFVGDRLRDVQPGILHGGTVYLLRGPEGEGGPNGEQILVVDSLAEAVDHLLEHLGSD